ncbi:MAG: family 10 glycosylhydrolase, partial [Verrucomicrobiia bacterium]
MLLPVAIPAKKFTFLTHSSTSRIIGILAVFAGLLPVSAQKRYSYVEVTDVALPTLPREFRAAWVATVGNIDWPSKPGLPVAKQKAEMIAILNRLQALKMNAVILQVRPTADALYPSKLEPWSWYLTGNMGQQPHPYYDPISFTIE